MDVLQAHVGCLVCEDQVRKDDVELWMQLCQEHTPPVAHNLQLTCIPLEFRPEIKLPDKLQSWGPKRGLYIYGKCGVGKSHAAAQIARDSYTKLGKVMPKVVFTTSRELLQGMRDAFNKEGESRFKETKTADLLVLDDIGTESVTTWVAEQLLDVVDHRYKWQLPTIYTSNKNLAELSAHVGERLASRIAGTCEQVRYLGDDRRRKKTA